MSWTLLVVLVVALGLALFASITRRNELQRMERAVKDRDRAVRQGADQAQLQHPVIDLSRCLGCGTCVSVCPEDGVLELVHGQAMVVNGARCVGVSACERECPVGAITVTLGDVSERDDIPALDGLEAVGSPGLFLAGEVTAHALIKTAVEHGTAVASEVARRTTELEDTGAAIDESVLDLVIVGAGPAGLACALEAKRHDLQTVVIEQESGLGGTVAKYPRRKLVMTEPVELPLHGRLKQRSYTKEQLMELWHEIAAEHGLPLRSDEPFWGVERGDDGVFQVRTANGYYAARHVCLAIGRRGIPRKLDIPGEDLPKVAYSLMDAASYHGRRIVVVGGGDSAVEAAMGLAEQPDNDVILSYRKESFFRIRGKNEERLRQVVADGRLRVALRSNLTSIHPDAIEMRIDKPEGTKTLRLPNDDVFVMAGGIPPFELLKSAGVSFDPSLIEAQPTTSERGTGLVRALTAGFVLTLTALVWLLWHGDYYQLPLEERPAHDKHTALRPGLGVGLWLGIAATAMIVLNLLYLLRRSPKIKFSLGSLQLWMTSHVATGILALLCAMVHGAMEPRDTPGGYAFWALVILLVTGAIGRYFYAWVPRAANGRELELEEVRTRLANMSEERSSTAREFAERARTVVSDLIDKRQWRSSFLGRVLALVGVQFGLRRVLRNLQSEGQQAGIADLQIEETLQLARRAHYAALMVGHFEDVRAVLNTWRWLHRWVAVLMVILVAVHVYHALTYGAFYFEPEIE